MDTARFDLLARIASVLLSRRSLAVVLGLNVNGLHSLVDAKKKRRKKRKKKKIKRNSFGCVNVGNFCKNAGQCCSGICQDTKPGKGKKVRTRCVAHNVDDCPAGADSCLEGLDPCTNGLCYQTTGHSSFCASGGVCEDCTRDTDCEPVFGEGAACAVCSDCVAGTSCLFAANPGNREPRRPL